MSLKVWRKAENVSISKISGWVRHHVYDEQCLSLKVRIHWDIVDLCNSRTRPLSQGALRTDFASLYVHKWIRMLTQKSYKNPVIPFLFCPVKLVSKMNTMPLLSMNQKQRFHDLRMLSWFLLMNGEKKSPTNTITRATRISALGNLT